MKVTLKGKEVTVRGGELALIPLAEGESAEAHLEPARGLDVGAGRGRELTATLQGGVVGVILDGRGRPLKLSADPATRRTQLKSWEDALSLYPAQS